MYEMIKLRSTIFVSVLFCGFLVSCVSSDVDKSQSISTTSEAMKRARQETELAAPTRTPFPTLTPENPQAAFEKCRGAAYGGLSYTVSATSGEVSEVLLTLTDDTGETIKGEYPLPFCINYIDFSSGDSVSISARITLPTESAGSIKCEILRAGGTLDVGYAEGYGSTITCSGTIP